MGPVIGFMLMWRDSGVNSRNSVFVATARKAVLMESDYTCKLDTPGDDACQFDSCMLVTALPGRILRSQRL